jgi:hypothetical protein
MAPLSDPQILACIKQVLQNWHVTDYVTWKDVARDWVGRNLEALSPRDIARILHEFVQNGGVIDRVRENRPEWSDREFHYDFRVPIGVRVLYIETVLVDDDPTDPTIHVVSIHDA